MTKNTKKDKPTSQSSEERGISPAWKRLLAKGKEVPHPRTVRVNIFPNPRVNRPKKKE